MVITISGVPGSGKTSVGKIVAQKLGWPFYSVGALSTEIALKRGLTLDELHAIDEHDSTTDNYLDAYQTELGRNQDNFVIEGRLSWHFIPKSFKIFLDCDTKEAARRTLISKVDRPDEKIPPDLATIEQGIVDRLASDDRRYKKYYDLDYLDKKNYDLVLDTTDLKGVGAVAKAIIQALPEVIQHR
ncbi:MAG: cytidylate kinase family protein [Patescibacteria group bacterium]|jgi:cytidylate kinase